MTFSTNIASNDIVSDGNLDCNLDEHFTFLETMQGFFKSSMLPVIIVIIIIIIIFFFFSHDSVYLS